MAKDVFERMAEAPAVGLEKTLEAAHHLTEGLTNPKPVKKVGEYWKTLGPGLTTGAADDDPSGIATYSQTGAQYGFQLLWLSAFTFPLMATVQEMCARIGLVTGQGLAANIRIHFPRWVLYLCTILLFAANTLNLGADLGMMAKAAKLLLPEVRFSYLVIGFAVVSLLLQIFTTYERYAKYLKWLALVLLAYIVSALLANLDWANVLRQTVTPSLSFSKDQIFLICAILGTTISPYLFFWQTSQEVEEEILDGKVRLMDRKGSDATHIKNMRVDVWSGMFLSNVVMFFIIAAAAGVLHVSGITEIESAEQAAQALRPLAGDASYILFALGIIGTGLLAVPVLAGSSSYALAESFGWKRGLYRKLREAYAFYGVIIISMAVGLGLNFIGLDPIKTLIYSAVANGMVAPVVLVLIVLLASSKKVMGEWRNHPLTTWVGWGTVAVMAAAGLATMWSWVG